MIISGARVLDISDSRHAEEALIEIGVNPGSVSSMAAKAVHRLVIVEGIEGWAANIVKQEMLARGGEAALARDVYYLRGGATTIVLMGTQSQLAKVCAELGRHSRGLPAIAQKIRQALDAFESPSSSFRIGPHQWDFGERSYIMGILNVTPDSFYDGGRYESLKLAVDRGRELVEEGADVIDVGGESSRPGSDAVPTAEERRRVVPVVEALVKELDVPVSIDTYKVDVATAAVDAGAVMINDITGLEDPGMVELAAQSESAVVVMHMKGRPKTMQRNPEYESVMGEISAFLRERTDRAVAAGVANDCLLVDPGIGFGKSQEHNLDIMFHLSELRSLGFPILLGPSRKSFIGEILKVPVEERLEGTIAAVVQGLAQGANVLRVHDVSVMSRVARMTEAMMRPDKVGLAEDG